MTNSNSIIVCGLPGSGKTTFLAALWHVVQSCEIDSALTLNSLEYAEFDYVNAIRERWLKGLRQPRTVGEARTIGIDLRNSDGNSATLLFPDHSGETFDAIWSTRACDSVVADRLSDRRGVFLFLRHEPRQPVPLTESIAAEAEMLGALPAEEPEQTPPSPQPWNPEKSPDQVKVVDTLQTLATKLGGGPEKLAVFVSAWDLAPSGDSPEEFVRREMPLLHQFLKHGDHEFDIRIYGVSAQGGEYVDDGHDGALPEQLEDLLALDTASARIRLVFGNDETHDLTLPISWLMS